jgi:glutathione S-transferase
LNRVLRDQDYLLGDSFTVADVNVATTLSQPSELGLIGWQRVSPAKVGLAGLARWLDRCSARPSYARVLGLP